MSKRKKKPKRPYPPLSRLDKATYVILILLSLGLGFAIALGWSYVKEELIAFSDEPVAVCHDVVHFLAVVPLTLIVYFGGLILFAVGFHTKIPILGNPKVEYGTHPWPKKLYPIFDERRRLYPRKPEDKKRTRRTVGIVCALLLFSFCLSGLGLCQRECLYRDGSFKAFNTFNKVSEYSLRDYERMELRMYESRGRISVWTYSMEIICSDGHSFTFHRGNFADPDVAADMLLMMKSMFPEDKIRISGGANIETFLEEKTNVSEMEEKVLREIFLD